MKKTLTILSVCLAAAHPLSAEETLEVGTQSPDSQALGAEITETVETDVPPAFSRVPKPKTSPTLSSRKPTTASPKPTSSKPKNFRPTTVSFGIPKSRLTMRQPQKPTFPSDCAPKKPPKANSNTSRRPSNSTANKTSCSVKSSPISPSNNCALTKTTSLR